MGRIGSCVIGLLLLGASPVHPKVRSRNDPKAVPVEGAREGCGVIPQPPEGGRRLRCYWYPQDDTQCCEDEYKEIKGDLVYTCQRANCQGECNGLWIVMGYSCNFTNWVESR